MEKIKMISYSVNFVEQNNRFGYVVQYTIKNKK